MSSYEDYWNGMSGYSAILINTHGNPVMLASNSTPSGDNEILTVGEINNLSYKNVNVLILTGCNSGHYDYVDENVAFAFSKRISGCVIASDGTVEAIGFINMNSEPMTVESYVIYGETDSEKYVVYMSYVE